MDIDAIIAEATQVAAQPEPSQTTEVTEVEQTGDQEVVEEKPLDQKTDEELTPEQLAKRERNRESKLSKKLAEMKRANRDLQARLANQPKVQNQDLSKEPDANSPEWKDKPWVEFSKAHNSWLFKQQFAENTQKAQETQQRDNYMKWVDDRSSRVDERLPELSAAIPDIDEVLAEVEDLAQSLSPEQARVALEAEDINLAVYTLYKEGKLEEAIKLPPSQLAAYIAKAEVRGQKYLTEPKQTTNAPRPMNAAKGNTTGGKSLERQSVDELMSGFGFR